jgi:hypothetical protein
LFFLGEQPDDVVFLLNLPPWRYLEDLSRLVRAAAIFRARTNASSELLLGGQTGSFPAVPPARRCLYDLSRQGWSPIHFILVEAGFLLLGVPFLAPAFYVTGGTSCLFFIKASNFFWPSDVYSGAISLNIPAAAEGIMESKTAELKSLTG